MRDLVERPLVCVTVAFAAGVASTAAMVHAAMWAWAALAAGCAGVWVWRRRREWVGAAIAAAAGLAGGLVWLACAVPGAGAVERLPEGGQTLVGTVAGAPRYAKGIWRFVLAAEQHEGGGGAEPVRGRVYVRMKSSERVRRGQRWRLTGKLRRLRGATNPGGRSERARMGALGVSGVLAVGAAELAQRVGEGDLGPLARHAYAAQSAALDTLRTHIPGPYHEVAAAVAAGVIFGVHATPPPREITEMFRRGGTIHLLVVSGAMVSMVFGMVFLPGALGAGWRRIRVERQFRWTAYTGRGRIRLYPGLWAALAAMLVVTYYAVLTEGGQAVVRAAVMGVFAALALTLRRVPGVAREHGLNVDRYTLLAAAALAILVVHPEALFQAGFQLSFAAVWAILYLTPKAMWLVGWLPKWLGYTVVGTLAAQLATFPILAYHCGQAPIAGFGANLFAIPLAGVVLVSGMTTCGLGALAPWLAPAAGWVCGLATRWMVWVSGAFGSLPGACPEVGRPGVAALLAWFAGMLVLGYVLARTERGCRAGTPVPAGGER